MAVLTGTLPDLKAMAKKASEQPASAKKKTTAPDAKKPADLSKELSAAKKRIRELENTVSKIRKIAVVNPGKK